MPITIPNNISIDAFAQIVRSAKAQAPRDPNVDAEIRAAVAATGKDFWVAASNSILAEFGPKLPGPGAGVLSQPGSGRSWRAILGHFLHKYVWKYIRSRLAIAVASAAAAVGAWWAGTDSRPKSDPNVISRDQVIDRLNRIEEAVKEKAAGNGTLPVAQIQAILKDNRDELQNRPD